MSGAGRALADYGRASELLEEIANSRLPRRCWGRRESRDPFPACGGPEDPRRCTRSSSRPSGGRSARRARGAPARRSSSPEKDTMSGAPPGHWRRSTITARPTRRETPWPPAALYRARRRAARTPGCRGDRRSRPVARRTSTTEVRPALEIRGSGVARPRHPRWIRAGPCPPSPSEGAGPSRITVRIPPPPVLSRPPSPSTRRMTGPVPKTPQELPGLLGRLVGRALQERRVPRCLHRQHHGPTRA